MEKELLIKENDRNNSIQLSFMLELVYTVLTLCDYDIMTPYHKDFIEDMKRVIYPKVSREVISYFKQISQENFRFVIPCTIALSLVFEDGSIKSKGTIKPYYLKRFGGIEKVHDCVGQLNRFMAETHYTDIFIHKRTFYNDYMNKFKNIIFEVMRDVQAWYDSDHVKLTAYLSPLVHPGGFGVSTCHEHAKCVLGALMNVQNDIQFPLSYNVYFHEFSHHFVDQYVEDNWCSIRDLLGVRICTAVGNNDIPRHKEFICETIIRGLSNYYCFNKQLRINEQDYSSYPLSKNIFDALKKSNCTKIDHDVYKKMIGTIHAEIR